MLFVSIGIINTINTIVLISYSINFLLAQESKNTLVVLTVYKLIQQRHCSRVHQEHKSGFSYTEAFTLRPTR